MDVEPLADASQRFQTRCLACATMRPVVQASEAFAHLEVALRDDLRTRFPAIDVDIARHGDSVTCLISEAQVPWGEAVILWEEDEDLSDRDVREMILGVLTNIADNLWPDEATDPWPRCPKHTDHPLQPGLNGGRAGWLCLRDPRTFVPLGQLRNDL